jgi:hypothetical protein
MTDGHRKSHADGTTPHRPDVTEELVRLMPRDLVFSMQFLGESQHILLRHFHDFVEAEMRASGITQETYPMIHAFIESHALLLRDFVFSGVALSRQFPVREIERLIGDDTSLMRVDIWDQLKTHIEVAQQRFRAQIPALPAQLRGWEAPSPKPGAAP